MDAGAFIAIAAAVVAFMGMVVAYFAQQHASRSADAAKSTAETAERQARIVEEQWEGAKADAKPNVEARVTGAERDRGVGSVRKNNRICVGVTLLNLSTRRDIVQSVSVEFRRQTYNSGKTLTTKPHIPIEIEGGGAILELELYFDAHQEVADDAEEEATATVDCRFGGKLETAFSVFQ